MGLRKKYRNLEIVEYHQAPNGEKLYNKFAIVEGDLLVSAAAGLSREECELALPEYEKEKVFVFTG